MCVYLLLLQILKDCLIIVVIPGIFLIVQRFEAPLVGAGIMQKDILYYLCI